MSSKIWSATGLTGGGVSDLDTINGDSLTTGDISIVITNDLFYPYMLANDGATASSPDVIMPLENANDLRWKLKGMGGVTDSKNWDYRPWWMKDLTGGSDWDLDGQDADDLTVDDEVAMTLDQVNNKLYSHGYNSGHAAAAPPEISDQVASEDGYGASVVGKYNDTYDYIKMGSDNVDEYEPFVKFDSIEISNSNTIVSSSLTFMVASPQRNENYMRIYGNDADSATAPTSQAEFDSLTLTTAYVDLDLDTDPSIGSNVITADISTIVQEIVDRAGWVAGNDIMFIVKARSDADAYEQSFFSIDTVTDMTEASSGYDARWTMDSVTGATLNEAGGNYNGTISGGATQDSVNEQEGTDCMDFDGINGKVLVGDDNIFSIDAVNGNTLAFWFKAGDRTTQYSIIQKGAVTADANFEWIIYTTATQVWAVIADQVGNTIWSGYVPLTDTDWHHYTIVFTGVTTLTPIYIYKDGFDETIGSAGGGTYTNGADALGFGVGYTGHIQRFLLGKIDDIRWWVGQLSASEAAYLAGKGGFTPSGPKLNILGTGGGGGNTEDVPQVIYPDANSVSEYAWDLMSLQSASPLHIHYPYGETTTGGQLVFVSQAAQEDVVLQADTDTLSIKGGASSALTSAKFDPDTSVDLYYNNVKTLSTAATGITLATDPGQILTATGEVAIEINDDGNVELYYDNSNVLETTGTGIKFMTNPGVITDAGGQTGLNITANGPVSIYHNNVANITTALTGTQFNLAPHLLLNSGAETALSMTANGSVDLYYDNAISMKTQDSGILVGESSWMSLSVVAGGGAGDQTTTGYSIGQENPSYVGSGFDDDTTDANATGAWYAYNAGYQATGWVGQDFTAPITITSYTVMAWNSASRVNDPVNFTFEGSATGAWGGEEVTLDTVVGESFSGAQDKKTYTVDTPGAYRYYRINVTANNGGGFCIIQEIEMISSATGGSYIESAGIGMYLRDLDTSEVFLDAFVDGAVSLYYDDTKEAETVSGGLKATNAFQIGTSQLATAMSGADLTLVTGTAGTNTNAAIWNADGDIIDGWKPDESTIEVNGTDIRVKADGINDTHIDWGVGANQVSAVDIPIADAESLLAATEVESALTELGRHAFQHNLGGVEDASQGNIALSSDGGTPPTITLTFTGTVYWWSDSIRYSDSGTDTIQIADTNGSHLIYYDGATLSEVVNPSEAQVDAVIQDKCLIAWVYWNTNTNVTPILAYELHGVEMSGATHHWIHDNLGCQYKSGGTISGYTLSSAADADISFELTDIELYDEDYEIDINSSATPANQYEQALTAAHSGGLGASIPVLYRDDVSGHWIEQAASTLPYLVGGTPRIARMNDDGDGTWSIVEVGNGQYCNYFLIATNDWQYPVKMVPGTATYATKALALANGPDEIVEWGGLPSAEWIVMYRFLMHDSAGGTTDAEIIDIIDERAINITGASAVTATDHGALAGLNDDDHAQYVLVSDLEADRTTINTYWEDLTDGGATVLHSHAGAASVSNILINGAMYIDQRSSSSGYTSATTYPNNDDAYTLDRWILLSDGNDIVDVSKQDNGGVDGETAYIRLDVETVSKKFGIFQVIESADLFHVRGNSVSLSFDAKVTNATKLSDIRAAVISWDGVSNTVTSDCVSAWGAEGANITTVANWTLENTPANLSVTTSWVRYKIENISLDTADMTNVGVLIWQNNVATNDTAGIFLEITNVQLELGETASAYEPRQAEIETALCQRFFQKSYLKSTDVGSATSDGVVYFYQTAMANAAHTIVVSTTLPTQMRTAPTMTVYGPLTGTSGQIQMASGEVAATTTNAQTDTIRAGGADGASTTRLLKYHYTLDCEL